jgi:hypothetical protein
MDQLWAIMMGLPIAFVACRILLLLLPAAHVPRILVDATDGTLSNSCPKVFSFQ